LSLLLRQRHCRSRRPEPRRRRSRRALGGARGPSESPPPVRCPCRSRAMAARERAPRCSLARRRRAVGIDFYKHRLPFLIYISL
jgi:hypothetical protein